MKRILFVWLPMWPIERLSRHTPDAVPDEQPLALVENASHGIRITAVNTRAAREGVRLGASLADARAALPSLLSRPGEPARDRAALLKLARWAGRYGPARNVAGKEGLWIDITGVPHLFGGEAPLLEDLTGRLAGFGVTARTGLAGTIGAAYALARFSSANTPPMQRIAAPPSEEKRALAALPVEALRLDAEAVLLLKRLGLRYIGQLYDLPRAALERRFGSELSTRSKAPARARIAGAVLTRLDQALGAREEPLKALGEPPALSVRRSWSEPLISAGALEHEIEALSGALAEQLKAAGLGARRIRLSLYRTDGSVADVEAGLSSAASDAAHLMGLLKEKVRAIDAGFGIDVAALDALAVETLGASQIALTPEGGPAGEPEIAALIDRISNRLGAARITCLVPHESYIPERAEQRVAAMTSPTPRIRREGTHTAQRPPLLIAPPEPITVLAEIPEGPPMTFTWRRVRHRIVKADGPERIAPEWWKELDGVPSVRGRLAEGESRTPSRTRDYYRLEDDAGGRFWVYRDGLYQNTLESSPPRWFMHGLFG